MEIPSTRFDATDPFAQAKLQMRQAETVLRQMPSAQREQLLAEVLPPMPMHRPSAVTEPAVTMVTVKVEDWDGGPVARPAASMMFRRPRRVARHIPWQWRLIVTGIRSDTNDAQVGQAADEAIQQAAAPDDSTGPSSPQCHAGGASPLIRYRQTTK